jgi:hypothetical protein
MVRIVTAPIGTNFYGVEGLAVDEVCIKVIIKGIFISVMPLTLGPDIDNSFSEYFHVPIRSMTC